MVFLLTFTVVVNDYNEAKAVTGVEETFLISALLSFIASTAITKSGIVPDASKVLASFIESDTIDMDNLYIYLHDLIDKVNAGVVVSDEDMEMYNAWVEGVQEFYLDLIRDMNKTGAIEENSALSYITRLFDYEYVSEKDVQEAFSMFCLINNSASASSSLAKFGISNNVIACNRKFTSLLCQDMTSAVNLYMDKRNSSSDSSVSKDFENCSIKFLFENPSDLPSSDSDFIQFVNSLTCPYIAYEYVTYDGNISYYVYYREASNRIACNYQSNNNSIYFQFSDDGGKTSSKCTYNVYNSDGSFFLSFGKYSISNVAMYTNLYSSYYILFWNGLDRCENSLLDLFGVSSLPSSRLCSDDLVAVPDVSLPIDDLYNGSENRGQDIDTDVDDDMVIYSIDTSINDLSDEIAKLRVEIDSIDNSNMDYDDYVKAIDDAMERVHENTESKVEEGVKEDVAVQLGNVSWNIDDFKTSGLGSKFPFCIPYDLIKLISVFDREPVAPKFEIPFVFERWGINEVITVDFTDFEVVAKICRTLETFCFIGFLIMKTRNLIKG